MEINCNQCGKFLAEESGGSLGEIAAKLPEEVYVKNAALFSTKYTWLFFCSKHCAKLFYEANIPRDEETTRIIEKMKAEIPEKSKEIAKKMASLIKIVKTNADNHKTPRV